MKRVYCAWFMALGFTAIAAEGPKTFKAGEFTFTRPADWEWVETGPGSMRKAQLKVWGEDKKAAAEVVFFHFGEGSGGGTQANVDRWFSQFQEPREKINAKTEETTVGKTKITYVQAEGTYMSGMPAGPKTPQPNSMLQGAILESNQGNVFIRMTGPAALVKKAQPDFKKMVTSGLR